MSNTRTANEITPRCVGYRKAPIAYVPLALVLGTFTVLVVLGLRVAANPNTAPPGGAAPSDAALGIVDIADLPRTPPFADEIEPHRRLFDAIRMIETGSEKYNGPYCISRAYWREANEYAIMHGLIEESWNYDELVWHRQYCEQVILWYTARYGAATEEQIARKHNGGPDGENKWETLDYWQRVKALIEREL